MDREASMEWGPLDLVDHPGPEELQSLVDATEDADAARYRRLRDYAGLLSGALRRADAMGRLETALSVAAH